MNEKNVSKHLKVTGFPQGGGYVPFVRIAGRWLSTFGFELNETVLVSAENGRITIEKIEREIKEE